MPREADSGAKMTLRCPCGKDVRIAYPNNGLTRATCSCGVTHTAILRGQRIHTTMSER